MSAFANVRHLFDAADVRFCHLEGPLCEPSDDPERPKWRHSEPAMVSALVWAGIDKVSCASNVNYPASVALRIVEVTEAGVAFAGVGSNRGTPEPRPSSSAAGSGPDF